jgi:hypothetical protein
MTAEPPKPAFGGRTLEYGGFTRPGPLVRSQYRPPRKISDLRSPYQPRLAPCGVEMWRGGGRSPLDRCRPFR